MRIPVDSIPRLGRQLKLDLAEEWVRKAAEWALDAEPSALSGSLDVSPPQAQRRVTITPEVSVRAEVVCARCGEATDFAMSTTAPLSYLPAADSGSSDVELTDEEMDVGWYSDGVLDLDVVLREVIALAVPTRYTCADEEACDARTDALLAAATRDAPTGHPGFAVLKQIKN